MAKRRKKYPSRKGPDPVNSMINFAGAAVMRAYTKQKIKQAYEKGEGDAAVAAAMMIHGAKTIRRGNDSMIALGGLYGLNSALKDVEKQDRARSHSTNDIDDEDTNIQSADNMDRGQRYRKEVPATTRYIRVHDYEETRTHDYEEEIKFSTYKAKDNRYAWRLNCEDGSKYDIHPGDYETRDEYNRALREAKGNCKETDKIQEYEPHDIKPSEPENVNYEPKSVVCFCQVSLLSNGRTEYFRTDDPTIKRGDIVSVPNGESTTTGVIVSIENCSPDTFPKPLEDTEKIIGRLS